MYTKSVNDEKHYESSGLWASRILNPDGGWTPTKN
jgi:hypothetical protein